MASNIDELLNYIHNLPYFDRRLIIARETEPLSRFLYKYKSIDETNPTLIDRLRDLLVRSKFWLSSPLDFNDPFDMSAKTVAKGTAEERLERFETLLKAKKLSFSQRADKRKSFMRKSASDELEKEFRDVYIKHVAQTGIFSFAGHAKSILMWSHYAKDHTGVCIQFERARDFKTLGQALPVEYSSEYPEINFIKDFQKSISKSFLRKHEGWSYEKEHRIVRFGFAHTYVQFDPRAVVRIIMGCRSTTGEQAVIKSLLEERQRAHMPRV